VIIVTEGRMQLSLAHKSGSELLLSFFLFECCKTHKQIRPVSDCTRIRGRKSCKWAGDKRDGGSGGGDHWNVCQLSIKHFFIGSPSVMLLSRTECGSDEIKVKNKQQKSRHRLISSGKSVRKDGQGLSRSCCCTRSQTGRSHC
jgi:hypothetical protein